MPRKERHARYKEEGRCPHCGQRHDGKSVWCESCLADKREKEAKPQFCLGCGIVIPQRAGKKSPLRCAECKRVHALELQRERYKNLDPERKQEFIKRGTERTIKYRKRHPEKALDTSLRQRYGMTLEEVKAIYAKQNGKCAICKAELPSLISNKGKKVLNVDHCHSTGRVRGLLCSHCNMGLGLFREDASLLDAAAQYLKLHRASVP